MDNRFFEHPILNSPYEYPIRHWELDAQGQPTQQIIGKCRRAEFITPIPMPKKRKGSTLVQTEIVIDERKGRSTDRQQYETTETINQLRRVLDE
jgi:type III restriction enzyme